VAAAVEFAAGGFAGGRVERIAKAAGVNKQLVFHYFKSKERLYSTAVHTALSTFPPANPTGASPPEALKAGISAILKAVETEPLIRTALADCALARSGPEQVRDSVGQWRESHRSAIVEVLTDGQRNGFFREEMEPGTVAGVILNAVIGAALTTRPPESVADSFHPSVSDCQTLLGRLVVDYCAWH